MLIDVKHRRVLISSTITAASLLLCKEEGQVIGMGMPSLLLFKGPEGLASGLFPDLQVCLPCLKSFCLGIALHAHSKLQEDRQTLSSEVIHPIGQVHTCC